MGKKYEQRKNPMEIMRFIFPLVSSTSCTKEMRKRKKSFWDRVFFFSPTEQMSIEKFMHLNGRFV